MSRKKNNNKGFTLIELIIAMSILSVVLVMGYNIINKSDLFMGSQQKITNNQSIANIVNTYLAHDIEQSINIKPCENRNIVYTENTYKYVISKKNSNVEYKVILDDKKDVYSLLRTEGTSSIEIITNQLRNDNEPFTIILKENGTYKVKISYSENKKPKEYSFSISSRMTSKSGESNGSGDLKPNPEDIPQLPEEIGTNTHYIGFWMADLEKQEENNIYTWIDDKYAKGTSNKEKNNISANIRTWNEESSEYASIEDVIVSGSITGKSNVQKMWIYVSQGTTIEDFEIQCGQGNDSIKILDSNNSRISRDELALSGGANGGKWYACEVNGKISSFNITSGKISINKGIVNSGFMLIVYSEEPEDYGEADIIFEYNRNYQEPMNSNQFNMTNIIKIRNSNNSYETVDTKSDNAFNGSIQTRISNYTNDGNSPNILLMTEKSNDKRINNIYGKDIKKTKKAIMTLEGNIFFTDTSGLREIVPNKQYEFIFPPGTNFDRHIRISSLAKGEKGVLKINLIDD